MTFRKRIYDATKEVALEQEGWFIAREIVPEITNRFGLTVNSKRVGHYLSLMSDRWMLRQRRINEGLRERIWEYHTL